MQYRALFSETTRKMTVIALPSCVQKQRNIDENDLSVIVGDEQQFGNVDEEDDFYARGTQNRGANCHFCEDELVERQQGFGWSTKFSARFQLLKKRNLKFWVALVLGLGLIFHGLVAASRFWFWGPFYTAWNTSPCSMHTKYAKPWDVIRAKSAAQEIECAVG